MAQFSLQIYISYAQLCLFLSSLTHPYNDWSNRNYSQGFSWRPGSISFRALVEDGDHKINLYVDEPVPEMDENCVRAFRVPFEVSGNGDIEIASISDSSPLNIPIGMYSVQIEFLKIKEGKVPEVNLRLNKGETNFAILKADEDIDANSSLDLMAKAAL